MGDGNTVFRLLLLLAALVAGSYLARHAFSEGMHTVIAAQPGRTTYDSSGFDGPSACRLDSHLQYANPLQCRMEMRSREQNPLVFHAKPIRTMTKTESETASGWFMLATFAVPLSLGAAALLGFLLLRVSRETD